jgi:hypothetical protein
LEKLLAEAASAAKMPWPAQQARVNEIIFHNMANWLPEPERGAIRTQFRAEMARLKGIA